MWRWVTIGAFGALSITIACGSSSHDGAGAQAGSAGALAAGGSAGHGAATGGGGNAAPIELQDLCPIFTHDLCVYLMECQGARYQDAEHCEHELDCFGLPQLTEAAARGAVDYDPSQVGACHQRFVDSPCTFGFFLFTPDIYDVLQFCPGTISPKLNEGGTCSSDGECSEGLYCYKGADYQCPGKCQKFSSEGQDCAGSGRCAEGLDCDNDVCAPERQAGDDCGLGCNYSVSCPKDQICPENIWCDQMLGQCQSGRLLGEPCGQTGTAPKTSQAQCAIHLWCDGVGLGAGVCRAPSVEGGPCSDGFSACQEGLHCVGYAPFGAAATLGTCQAPGPIGSECLGGDDCQTGLACVLAKCAALGVEGADCDATEDCAAGLVCVDGSCASARYPGDPCDAERCTFSRCVDGTCEYHVKVGEPCVAAADCATGECIAGVCYDDSVCNAPEP